MGHWVIEMIYSAGYGGIVVLMFVENVFPPIPSEIIMPLAGYMVTQRRLTFVGIVAAGTLGSVLGSLPLYLLGKRIGEKRLERLAERYGAWLTISTDDVRRAGNWFDKHGPLAVFTCRLIPGIRSLISIPAGIHRMNAAAFLFYTAIGTSLWTALLAYAGYLLGAGFKNIDDYLDPAAYVVFGAIAVIYVARVIKCKRSARKAC
jgi:membrane protein DedA with SNARE-associated domain